MNLSRYIAVSTLSHLVLIGLLWITLSNIKPAASVFDVHIVGPLESEKPPVPKIPQPDITSRKPFAEKQHRPAFNEKLLPETLYGEGKGVHTHDTKTDTIKQQNNQAAKNGIASSQKDKGLAALPPVSNEGQGSSNEKGELPSGQDRPVLAPPSALFDKNTIEKYAKKEAPMDKGLTFEIPGFKHRGYMRMLREKIESLWRYPKEAARLGISGDLYVKFSIKKDGKLGEIELLRTSGYKDLDEAAMKALKDAEPFWPLPSDWEDDDLEITGHFLYIYGSAVIM